MEHNSETEGGARMSEDLAGLDDADVGLVEALGDGGGLGGGVGGQIQPSPW